MIYNTRYIHTVNRTFPHLPAKFSPHAHPGNPFGPVFPGREISPREMRALVFWQHKLNSINERGGSLRKGHYFWKSSWRISLSLCHGCPGHTSAPRLCPNCFKDNKTPISCSSSLLYNVFHYFLSLFQSSSREVGPTPLFNIGFNYLEEGLYIWCHSTKRHTRAPETLPTIFVAAKNM